MNAPHPIDVYSVLIMFGALAVIFLLLTLADALEAWLTDRRNNRRDDGKQKR